MIEAARLSHSVRAIDVADDASTLRYVSSLVSRFFRHVTTLASKPPSSQHDASMSLCRAFILSVSDILFFLLCDVRYLDRYFATTARDDS